MRILHLGKFFPPYPGGIERFVADLSAEQAAQGMEVRVLAHASPGTWRSRQFRVGAVDVTLAACPAQWVYAPVSPALAWHLARTLREFRPDILHLHVPNPSAFWALLSPAARRLPWVVHWHADIPLDSRRRALRAAYRIYRPWEGALLRRARVIVATSQAYADSSAALRPWRDKVRVVPLGIAVDEQESPATPLSSAHEEEPHAPRILAVGRLSYFKGFDVLLRAVAMLPSAELVLVGDGECAGSLHKLARQLGLQTRVRFFGHVAMDAVGQAQLATLHAQSDVFCLPSTERAESFGLVLLEAMRAGKPVVASDIPGSGVGFVVQDGQTGLLVPPGDAAALAAALRTLAADADLRQRMGAAGAQRFAEHFTLAAVAPAIAEIYRHLADATSTPAG